MVSFKETFKINEGTLHVVPAVHFRSPFAERVNQLCRDKDTRPDAIAVELGPEIAQYVYQWFLELQADGRWGQKFPCMLAVAAHNRRLRPSMQQRAIKLQEETGKDLEELDPEVLNKVLGYSSESVLFLSPADSIVEAIRSAVELGIPVYGVDLEEVADSERQEILIRDTGNLTTQDVPEWVGENLYSADCCRDDVIDERREITMAARLRTVVDRHDNVLFTCGAAHWLRIQKLLHDEATRPAIIRDLGATPAREYTRLIAHPSLAIYFLDPFPPWVENVQKRRESATTEWKDEDLIRAKMIRSQEVFHGLIEAAYTEFLQQSVSISDREAVVKQDSYAIHDFTTLVENLSVLENRVVPDLFSVFSAARGTISSDFRDILAEKFFRYDWCDPKEFGLPILFSIGSGYNSRMKVQVIDTNGNKGRDFFLNNLPGYGESRSRGNVPCPKNLESRYATDEKNEQGKLPDRLRNNEPEIPEGDSVLRTWDPTDDMFALMCCRAMTLARYNTEQRVSLPFEGSLYDGICIKSMIRAAAIGDERVYVRQKRRVYGQPEILERVMEPIVWLFDPEVTGADWKEYSQSLFELKNHCKARGLDPDKLDSIANESGSEYIAAMTYGSTDECEPQYQRAGIVLKVQLKGVVYFIPPICTESEDLEWMRQSDFKNTPIVPESNISSLINLYRGRYGINLDESDWVSTMIGLAIPFVRSSVVVVAPQSFTLDRTILQAARKLGKSITLVPLSYFSDSVVKRLQTNYAVKRQEHSEGKIFNPLAVRLLGDEPDSFKHQVPDWLCDLVGRARN